ncbi:hypothetical protein D1AOALGA4SA_6095 [Olavius algarvensis Delta 1 endosymbiont]|nr:hypothetical protein D1AOALGA4SA_6095 [Olavius algarvensis Delta 1 endosymbiont]
MSELLGFVPQPNLLKSSLYHDFRSKGETQQLSKRVLSNH